MLHRYLEGLSIGLINLVNILQPEIICLGGGISNAEDDLLLDPLRGLVLAGCFDAAPGESLPGQRRRSGRGCHAVQDAVRARLPAGRAAVEQEQGGLRRCGGRLGLWKKLSCEEFRHPQATE